jgi:AcrR family transcriptional regulator
VVSVLPLQLYDKEKILDACLPVFARHGYENTSTSMLAEAAGISKALIFHHFGSKKELYLSVLDRCFEKGRVEMEFDALLEHRDFFEAKERFSLTKFDYYKNNPHLYKFIREAFYDTPDELKKEIEAKYGNLIVNKDRELRRLFERVPLREGIDRDEAFKLIMIVLDYFETKYISELPEDGSMDETYLKSFLNERNRFLSMVRYGIEK